MKKPTLCCFTWIAFIELGFTAAFLLIRKTLDGRFVGNIVCTPPTPPTPTFLLSAGDGGWMEGGVEWEGEVEPPIKFLKRRAWRISIFRGGLLGKKGWPFLGGGFSFYIKNKLKSEIFNGKSLKVYKMFFYVINWGIFHENLVTCKRWDGVKEEKLYYGGSLKNPIFRGERGGGSRKTNI